MKEQVKLTQWNFGVVLNVVVKYVNAIVNTEKIKIKCHNTNSLCITMKPTEIKETASQGEKKASLTFRKNLQILSMLFRKQLKDDLLNRMHNQPIQHLPTQS